MKISFAEFSFYQGKKRTGNIKNKKYMKTRVDSTVYWKIFSVGVLTRRESQSPTLPFNIGLADR